MITSMTAFARQSKTAAWGSATWEVRSVNHRYLELNIKLPEAFRALEPSVRALCANYAKRGKMDVLLKFSPGVSAPIKLRANDFLCDQYLDLLNDLRVKQPAGQIDLTRLLSFQGIVETVHEADDALNQAILKLLETTLADAAKARAREGEQLKQKIDARLLWLDDERKKLAKCMPQLLEQQRQKICKRIDALNIEVNQDRLEQELVFWTSKTDVAEELDRMHVHLVEMQRILNEDTAAGRRLDFLTQELNREANTFGSKASEPQVHKQVIDMKVKIEQIREQVQNIE